MRAIAKIKRPTRAQVQAALHYWQAMCKPPDPDANKNRPGANRAAEEKKLSDLKSTPSRAKLQREPQ
jgi:hypothetical protein